MNTKRNAGKKKSKHRGYSMKLKTGIIVVIVSVLFLSCEQRTKCVIEHQSRIDGSWGAVIDVYGYAEEDNYKVAEAIIKNLHEKQLVTAEMRIRTVKK